MRLDLLQSKIFIFSLLLVLVNDFILKYNSPSWLTGKLSDFAGLFVFAVFWMAFFPKKRNTIVWATAIIFTWWKSPLSQPLIEYWNEIVFYSIDRVIDYSDLMALLVLPFAIVFCKSDSVARLRVSPVLTTLVSFFIFCSTSAIEPVLYEYPNPQIFVFKCEVDSSAVFEKELSMGDFEKDSTDWMRYKYKDKLFFHQNSYMNQQYRIESIGDSILLVKKMTEDYYDEYVHMKSNAGKVRFLDRIKQLKQDYLKGISNDKFEKLAEYPEFPYVENLQGWKIPKFKFFPISKRIIDSPFQISTNQFGKEELLSFKNSLLDGKYTQFWNSKTVKINGMYEAGIEKGTWEFFDSLGVKIKEEIYIDGELAKTKEFLSDGEVLNKNVATKKQVIRAHWIVLMIFITLLFVSFYYYKKWYKSNTPDEEIKMVDHLLRLVYSIAGGFVSAVFLFYFLLMIGSAMKIFYWDLPLDLEDVLFPALFSPIFIGLYILLTNRVKDFLWLILWVVLLLLIYKEYEYLYSF
ncbi:MAG: hypothetical protein AB8F94_09200 [Saprospiraceae bacterium]